jgi:hypothetical protein
VGDSAGVRPVAPLPDAAECLEGFVGGHRPAGTEYPSVPFLLHRLGRCRVALERNVEDVTWIEVQLVPESLGKDDPSPPDRESQSAVNKARYSFSSGLKQGIKQRTLTANENNCPWS